SFGVITDLHYAEKEPAGSRIYRDSGKKLRECIETITPLKPSFLIELGDCIDAAKKETERGYLRTIKSIFREFEGDCHHVIGNHDVATFTKGEFISLSEMRRNYYSFDHGECHFIVLDANYNRDFSDYNAGNFDWTETYIPPDEQEWLKHDLARSKQKTAIVFIHQNLHDETDPHGVKNAPVIRRILEDAGTVAAVFQGHDHRGGYKEINGIHYITFRAAVEGPGLENNSFAVVNIDTDGGIVVTGYGKQESYRL
ncbi:metallophosphoesterase family protein, partial [Candidatus Latescibacterota bacterium]